MSTGRRRGRTRRNTSASRPRSYSELYRGAATTQAVTAAATPDASPRSVEASDWTAEYAYVAGDLRFLLVVSLSLFALIILAGFVL